MTPTVNATSVRSQSRTYLTRTHDSGGKAAILFLHGFQGDAAETWGQFPAFLASRAELRGWDVFTMGYDTALYPDVLRGIWSANAGLETLAGLLRTTITLGKLADYSAIAVIAHSMGGLIAQRALLEPDVRRRVSHLFLFGTPSAGLLKASLARLLKSQFRDMSPNSDFLKNLRARWATEIGDTPPFSLFVVAGENDQFVPEARALSPFPQSVWHRVPGNHVGMVKPQHDDDLNVLVVAKGIARDKAATEVWNAARVAAQDRRARALIDERLSHSASLDQPSLVALALALDQVNRRADAISLLELYGKSTDGMGVLAGRLKRRWLADRHGQDAEAAMSLYSRALRMSMEAGDGEQTYYHAINVAFMQFAYRRDATKAREFAQQALDSCGQVSASMWSRATCGEAQLYLGNYDEALAAYRDAIGSGSGSWAKPSPWQVMSMFDQAIEVAELIGDEKLIERITELFQGAPPKRQ